MAKEPLASGNLEKTPFPHLLVYLEQKGMSGTLAVWPDDPGESKGQDRILFLKGKPMAGVLMGQADSLKTGMLQLFSRRKAPYAFYEGNLLGNSERRLSERIEPLPLIATALRRGDARDDVIAQVLARVAGVPLSLAPDVDISRFGFVDDEQPVVERLRAGGMPLDALVEEAGVDPKRAQRVAYLLVISRAVETGHAAAARASAPGGPPASAPADAPAQPATPAGAAPNTADTADTTAAADGSDAEPRSLHSIPEPPDSLDDELRKRWQQIATKGRLIENQNYFEMLEISRKATASEAKSAFLQLAKSWHPDRLPKELSALKPFVQTMFGYMSEASGTLSIEEDRLKYLQTVREGGGTPAAEKLMERILDSAMQYERVLVFSRKHEYDRALEVLRQILKVTKDEPDYHAMYGWLLMQKFPNKPGVQAPFDEILASFTTALELHEDHEKAHLYKGQMLRRMGRSKDALAEFKAVVRLNPNNVEAAREVRIAKMRTSMAPGGKGGKGGKKDGGGGFLGKLFGKK